LADRSGKSSIANAFSVMTVSGIVTLLAVAVTRTSLSAIWRNKFFILFLYYCYCFILSSPFKSSFESNESNQKLLLLRKKKKTFAEKNIFKQNVYAIFCQSFITKLVFNKLVILIILSFYCHLLIISSVS
jgi:hypothetical protein